MAAREDIRAVLAAHHVATLATTSAAGPWAAAVFYVCDDALNLYFLSDPRTRHGRDLLADARVAVAIQPEVRDWRAIRGLQLEGRVEALVGGARDHALARYRERFPEVGALDADGADPDAAKVAGALASATVYRIRPAWVRWIDNRRGFGFKEELRLD